MAPSMTHGAVKPSQRSPAIKVWVCHFPNGASALRRSPRSARPRIGVMFVFTLVSSIKISRPGLVRMKGWRCSIHTRRACLTSERSFYDARSVFFIGEASSAEQFRQVRWIDNHTMCGFKPDSEIEHGDIGVSLHLLNNHILIGAEFTGPFWTALASRFYRSGRLEALLQFQQSPKMRIPFKKDSYFLPRALTLERAMQGART